MNIDITKLQARAEDLRIKIEAIAAAVPAGFSTPEANAYFAQIHELAIDTIEAVAFLSAGGDVPRLGARVSILRTRIAVVRKLLGDEAPDAFIQELLDLAADTIEALELQADVRAEVDKATKRTDPDSGV